MLPQQGVGELAGCQDVLRREASPQPFEIRPEIESTLRPWAHDVPAGDAQCRGARYRRMDARAVADVILDIIIAGDREYGGLLYRCSHAGPGLARDGVQCGKERSLVRGHEPESHPPAAE
jgi:hypothetical protein